MKIVATIIGYKQVSEHDFTTYRYSYIFDSSDSLEYIMEKTGVTNIFELNLSQVEEYHKEQS